MSTSINLGYTDTHAANAAKARGASVMNKLTIEMTAAAIAEAVRRVNDGQK